MCLHPAGEKLMEDTPKTPTLVLSRETNDAGKDDDGKYASYHAKTNTIQFNSVQMADLISSVDPDAASGRDLKDPKVLRDYLLEHPETMDKIKDKCDVTYYHERVHAFQETRHKAEGSL